MPAYSRLTRQQRYTIESMLHNGYSQKSIAEAIGVNPSTVSRELRRGGMDRASHCYVAAQRDADSHEWKSVRICPEVWKRVEEKLCGQQWSPQQISAALSISGEGKVSHGAIYQHIYREKKSGG